MTVTETSTLAEIATTHPGAARVFHRHDLDYCDGGGRALAEACRECGLDREAILVEIERCDAVISSGRRWDLEPLAALVSHIVAYHHRRLHDALPDLIRVAAEVETRHGEQTGYPRGLASHLAVMQSAVQQHLAKEEQVLFPMILRGGGACVRGLVETLQAEHDEQGRILQAMRRITDDWQAPEGACTTWRALYLDLQELDRELIEQIHLENTVLFSRALDG